MERQIEAVRKICTGYYEKLEVIHATVKKVFKIKEILNLTKIVEKYPKNGTSKDLVDYLFMISSYSERLIYIRNSLYYQERNVKFLVKKVATHMQEEYFMTLKRQDRTVFKDRILAEFQIELEDLETKIKIISDSIEHLNNVQFNVKTTISLLKSEYHGRG